MTRTEQLQREQEQREFREALKTEESWRAYCKKEIERERANAPEWYKKCLDEAVKYQEEHDLRVRSALFIADVIGYRGRIAKYKWNDMVVKPCGIVETPDEYYFLLWNLRDRSLSIELQGQVETINYDDARENPEFSIAFWMIDNDIDNLAKTLEEQARSTYREGLIFFDFE